MRSVSTEMPFDARLRKARHALVWAPILSVLLLASRAGGAERFLDCYVVSPPEAVPSDSQCTSLAVGPDGTVYISMSSSSASYLIRYDPGSGDVQGLLRLTSGGASAIQISLLNMSAGNLYAATRHAELPEDLPEYGEDSSGYPGGRLFRYYPGSRVADLGILKQQEGLLAAGADPLRGKLYFLSQPKGHFLVYDAAAGTVEDKGEIGTWSLRPVTTGDGSAYLPAGGSGFPVMTKYDPTSEELLDLPIQIIGASDYVAPAALCPGPDDTRLYGASPESEYLMEFDLSPEDSVTLRFVARIMSEEYQVEQIGDMVLGNDGRIYYPCLARSAFESEPRLHILRYDPQTGAREDLGIPRPDGPSGQRVVDAATGPDGTLYLAIAEPPNPVIFFPELTSPEQPD